MEDELLVREEGWAVVVLANKCKFVFCRPIRSMTEGRWLNLMIYCIHKGKREATDG